MAVLINTHDRLSDLQYKVQADMGVGYVRLDWMPEGEPFEVKAFVLNQLSRMHFDLCGQGIHDMKVGGGSGGASCRYCSWGWGSTTFKAFNVEPGIEV